jgi:UDPglucose--hexose-1-phosphate uridylyltransferase
VRVVPNLYPAFERQEVVVSTPRHVRTFADLEANELASIAEAWRLRAEAARSDGFGYLHALLNEGREAGASLPHSHTQLVWLREVPPAVAAERMTAGNCGVCEVVSSGANEVEERDGLVVLCPSASRLPYEALIAPRDHEPDGFRSNRLRTALGLLAETIGRLTDLAGTVSLNAWLHTAGFGGDGHWHIELVPRLSILAGVELGAGIAINTLAPEEAAQALRAAGQSDGS